MDQGRSYVVVERRGCNSSVVRTFYKGIGKLR